MLSSHLAFRQRQVHESDCVRPPSDRVQPKSGELSGRLPGATARRFLLRSRPHSRRNCKISSLDTFRSRRLRERPIRLSRCREELRNRHRRRRWNCLGHKVRRDRRSKCRLSASRKLPPAEFRSLPLTTPDDGFRTCASRISTSMKMESSGRFSVFSATSRRPQVSESWLTPVTACRGSWRPPKPRFTTSSEEGF